MSIDVKIKKDFGSFVLDLAFQSESKKIGILGASGCGKSMALKSIAGIERPDEGRIIINGKVHYDEGKRIFLKPQVRNVGYLFQNYALFPMMTVEQNISAGVRGDKLQVRARVRQMVERFHLEGLEKRYPGELSGGQQQRTALARIMAYEPEVILLDEPFSALDVYLKDQMQRELIDLLKSYKGLVVLVSHSRDEVYRMSEELLILDHGTIVRQGQTKKLFEQPGNVVTARLTGCKNIVSVTRRPDGAFYANAWDLKLCLKNRSKQDVKAIAIRAHEFCTERTPENEHLCFPVLNPVITEDLFEYNISFQTSPQAQQRLDWKVSKYMFPYSIEHLPQQLFLKEQDILLLE